MSIFNIIIYGINSSETKRVNKKRLESFFIYTKSWRINKLIFHWKQIIASDNYFDE